MLKIRIKGSKINLSKFKNSILIYDKIGKKFLKLIEIDKKMEIDKINLSKIKNFDLLICFGSGKTIDKIKIFSMKFKKDYIVIPTSLSSDVITSPTISLKFKRTVKSIFYRLPKMVIISKEIIEKAPQETIKAGVCDCIAKISSVKDWEIANEIINEKIIKKAHYLALKCAKNSLENIQKIINGNIKKLMKSFEYSGLAAHYAKSSRPISGSEHNFSHAIDLFSKYKSLHGFQVGLGTIISRRLQQENDYKDLIEIFRDHNIPTSYKEIKIPQKYLVLALMKAKYVRKRFTVLNTIRITKSFANKLLKELKII